MLVKLKKSEKWIRPKALFGGASNVFATLKPLFKLTSFDIFKLPKPDLGGL
jgi:hypothetical protein